jgi:hypothetical protein
MSEVKPLSLRTERRGRACPALINRAPPTDASSAETRPTRVIRVPLAEKTEGWARSGQGTPCPYVTVRQGIAGQARNDRGFQSQ